MTYPGIENDPAAVAADPDRAAVAERRKERDAEFGTYVAVTDIPWGTVTAFFAGEAVPKSTVERYDWIGMGLVRTVEAAPAADETAPAGPQRDAAVETAPPVTTADTVTTKPAKAPKTGGSE